MLGILQAKINTISRVVGGDRDTKLRCSSEKLLLEINKNNDGSNNNHEKINKFILMKKKKKKKLEWDFT